MNWQEAIQLHREMIETELSTRERKAHDYSATEDVLSNFFAAAAVFSAFRDNYCEIDITKPWGVALFFKIIKMIRIVNLIQRDSTASCEPLFDSFMDERVYTELARECLMEEQRREAKETESARENAN